jgi:serine/threonine-protein kinase
MDLDRWRAVERVLDRALASDPSSWPALLADTCGGDPALRVEVEALLAQRSAADDFLASPPTAAVSALVAEEQGRVGSVIPSEARNSWPPDRENKDSSLRSE